MACSFLLSWLDRMGERVAKPQNGEERRGRGNGSNEFRLKHLPSGVIISGISLTGGDQPGAEHQRQVLSECLPQQTQLLPAVLAS